MLTGFWILGAVLIVIAVVLVILFAIGLSRKSNVRDRAANAAEPNIPRDPTARKQADSVADSGATGGNYSRSVPYNQDTSKGNADKLG